MSFTRMGDGLAGVVKSWAKDPEFRWSLIERAWRSAAGETVGDRATAESFEGGTVTVRVSDPSGRTEERRVGKEGSARGAPYQ